MLKFIIILALIIVVGLFIRGKYMESQRNKNNVESKSPDMCVETSCTNIRAENSGYCWQHGCVICGSKRYNDSLYCYQHRLGF